MSTVVRALKRLVWQEWDPMISSPFFKPKTYRYPAPGSQKRPRYPQKPIDASGYAYFTRNSREKSYFARKHPTAVSVKDMPKESIHPSKLPPLPGDAWKPRGVGSRPVE